MKIREELRAMSPTQRRQFLKLMGCALGAPGVAAGVRYAFNDVVGGSKYAEAQTAAEGTLFLEFNFRDQVDLMHVFVPPGLATHQNLTRGVNGDACTLFEMPEQITSHANRFYLTQDSQELIPHLDTIAIVDTGEAGIGGVHGHEAGNGIRSPGRTKNANSGKPAMYLSDGASGAGSDEIYTSTPTPLAVHNYYQKQLDPTLKNGFAFKGISRFKHSVYHFEAGLTGGEPDRIPSRDVLYETFPALEQDASVLPTPEQADLLTQILKTVDSRYVNARFADGVGIGHIQQLDEARNLLHVANPKVVSLPLTPEEETRWSAGVPNQQCTRGDAEAFDCAFDGNDNFSKAQIWEQFAYASKVLRSGATRSVALEFDFMDLHGDNVRIESVLRTQAAQCALPLARLITDLKEAGLYDRTVIAVYTLDGSRRPAANSYGDDGKGTMILAGGGIVGGYYGDIQVASDTGSGHMYSFLKPDTVTGMPTAPVTDWGDPSQRTPSADLWLTLMKALKIPDDISRQFPDVQNGRTLDFLLRG